MSRLLFLCLIPLLASAEDRWTRYAIGPFELYTDAGAKNGREALGRFEQFRYALGKTIGVDDMKTDMPVRILLFKNSGEAHSYEGTETITRGRDRLAIVVASGAAWSPALARELAKLFLNSSSERIPDTYERGLIDVFATVEISGTHVTLGRPPAAPERNLDWARVHMLATTEEFYGKLRVLLYNLRKGVADDAAYRNAVGKTAAEIDRLAQAYLLAGKFGTAAAPGEPLNVDRDLPEKKVDPDAMQLALADLLLSDRSRDSYELMLRDGIHTVEAHEGLGLLNAPANRIEEARGHFSQAMEAGSKNARIYVEYARIETDTAKAVAALEKARKLNPKLADAPFLLGQRETDGVKRIAALKAAAALAPRNASYWQALAEAALDAKDFAEAAKAWRGAEQAATSDSERARFHQARMAIEGQRLDYEAAERKRIADEKEREMQRLKEKALAEVRALESRVNQRSSSEKPLGEVVPWWDGPKPEGRVSGALKQVDCLGGPARLVVQGDDGKLVKLLVRDPGQVAISGGGQQSLACGPQQNRRVTIEYAPKADKKTATAGEVAAIQFQ